MNRYPKLDLHGEFASTAYSIVHSFLLEQWRLKQEIVILIHGKGSGVLKQEVHHILKQEPFVKEFNLDPKNLGQTLVRLNLNYVFKKANR